jgi:hypothetical protein
MRVLVEVVALAIFGCDAPPQAVDRRRVELRRKSKLRDPFSGFIHARNVSLLWCLSALSLVVAGGARAHPVTQDKVDTGLLVQQYSVQWSVLHARARA